MVLLLLFSRTWILEEARASAYNPGPVHNIFWWGCLVELFCHIRHILRCELGITLPHQLLNKAFKASRHFLQTVGHTTPCRKYSNRTIYVLQASSDSIRIFKSAQWANGTSHRTGSGSNQQVNQYVHPMIIPRNTSICASEKCLEY